jgi:hypothetical protein
MINPIYKTPKKRSWSRGHVLIELLIVAPVLLMIPAGVLEYTRFLRYDQIAVAFSQEAANQAYRQCTDWNAVTQGATRVTFDEPTSTRLTRECIEAVRNDIQGMLALRMPGVGSRVILAVYRYNYGLVSNTDTAQVAIVPPQGATGLVTNTRIEVVPNSAALRRTTDQRELVSAAQAAIRQRMVVAEVTFGYNPVFALFNAFMAANSAGTDEGFRETTIL